MTFYAIQHPVESSDDLELGERPRVVDISKIWDEDEDIDDFIEYDRMWHL